MQRTSASHASVSAAAKENKPTMFAQATVFSSTTPSARRVKTVPSRRRGIRVVAALSSDAPSSPRSSPPPAQRKRVRAEDFRHPLDQQNTQILQAIPGLSNLTKALVTPLAEQMLIMEQISTSVLVGREEREEHARLDSQLEWGGKRKRKTKNAC